MRIAAVGVILWCDNFIWSCITLKKIVINGGHKLTGKVNISGAKNAASAIIPAAICASGVSIIENLPLVEDIACFMNILTKLGAKCEMLNEHAMRIDASSVSNIPATFECVKNIRASYYTMGALLGRFNQAEVAMPGGCDFGSRPIDLHIKGFEALGAKTQTVGGILKMHAPNGLRGASIYLDIPSVGATINIMLAAIRANGQTIIENAAKEPHVVDTASFLNMLGANIKGAGTDIIRINGVSQLSGAQYTIIPDQIEAGTYMIAAAATGGDVTVANVIPKHMDSLSAKLSEMNCTVIEDDDSIRVIADKPLNAVRAKAMFYPGLPTDLQPQLTALLTTAHGQSSVTESVFDNRFRYVHELTRLNAKISVTGNTAYINGPAELVGAEVSATDLRAGAALIIGGLCAEGKTTISNIAHIDRGYENVVEKLCSLGADVERVG